MHRWPLGSADAGDRDLPRGVAGASPGLRSGPAAGRAVAFGRRERQPFMRAGSSAAGAMSEWPGRRRRRGGLEAGWRPAERPLAGVVGELERRRRRVRRQSHRHTSRRSACRLWRPRPGARGTAARRLPFGMPRRIVSAIHAVTASAPRRRRRSLPRRRIRRRGRRRGRRPGRPRRPLRPPGRARGRSGRSRARRGRRPRTADPSPRVLVAGRSRASGHTSQWRAGAGAMLRTRLPMGTGRGRAGSRSIPIQGSGPAITSLNARAGSGTHGSGVTCCTPRGSAPASCASRRGVSPRGHPGVPQRPSGAVDRVVFGARRRTWTESEHGLILLSGRMCRRIRRLG